VVAVTDFMRAVPEQIAPYLPGRRFTALGTDGMGRSDTREALRRFFETDAAHVVVAVLEALAADGTVPHSAVRDAIVRHGIDPDAEAPWRV
jgi:pyruvate dehydrogenase E1 component